MKLANLFMAFCMAWWFFIFCVSLSVPGPLGFVGCITSFVAASTTVWAWRSMLRP